MAQVEREPRKNERTLIWAGAAGLTALAFLGLWYLTAPQTASRAPCVLESLRRWLDVCYSHTLFDRFLLIGTAALLALEWWLPAEPRQGVFSVGFSHDAVWFLLEGVMRVGLVTIYVDALCRLYDTYVGFLTL